MSPAATPVLCGVLWRREGTKRLIHSASSPSSQWIACSSRLLRHSSYASPPIVVGHKQSINPVSASIDWHLRVPAVASARRRGRRRGPGQYRRNGSARPSTRVQPTHSTTSASRTPKAGAYRKDPVSIRARRRSMHSFPLAPKFLNREQRSGTAGFGARDFAASP